MPSPEPQPADRSCASAHVSAESVDRAARAFLDHLAVLDRSRTTGLAFDNTGAAALRSGAGIERLNGVVTRERHHDATAIAALAKGFVASRVPWSIQTRTEPTPELAATAAALGLTVRSEVPLMIAPLVRLPRPGEPHRVEVIDGISREAYLDVLGRGFEAPTAPMVAIAQPWLLDDPGVRAWGIRNDGVYTSTALGVVLGEFASVFSVATDPQWRGRGQARAAVSAVMRWALSRGAEYALLQPTPQAQSLYRSLGFITLESWTYLAGE